MYMVILPSKTFFLLLMTIYGKMPQHDSICMINFSIGYYFKDDVIKAVNKWKKAGISRFPEVGNLSILR